MCLSLRAALTFPDVAPSSLDRSFVHMVASLLAPSGQKVRKPEMSPAGCKLALAHWMTATTEACHRLTLESKLPDAGADGNLVRACVGSFVTPWRSATSSRGEIRAGRCERTETSARISGGSRTMGTIERHPRGFQNRGMTGMTFPRFFSWSAGLVDRLYRAER